MTHQCDECESPLVISQYTRKRMATPQPERCRRCGVVYSVHRGHVERISPAMHPVDQQGRLSPWMLWYTRPVCVGWYDCRFSELEPVHVRLWWNERNFQVGPNDARRVVMRTFLSWRGVWLP